MRGGRVGGDAFSRMQEKKGVKKAGDGRDNLAILTVSEAHASAFLIPPSWPRTEFRRGRFREGGHEAVVFFG